MGYCNGFTRFGKDLPVMSAVLISNVNNAIALIRSSTST